MRPDCPVCRIPLSLTATHCPRCGLRVAPLERRPRRRPDAGRSRRLLPAAPRGPLEAVRLGLAGGAVLVCVALVVAGLTRAVGGDAMAALGNTSLLLGMATLGVAALLGGVRAPRWLDYGPGGPERFRRRVAGSGGGVGPPVRLAVAVAGTLPFALFIVLAATR